MLISEGIDKVRAIELPVGVWASGKYLASNRVALVKWQSSWTDKFYQVYVNGQFAGATVSTNQRQLTVGLPASFITAVRIEIFAVDAGSAHQDFRSELINNTAQGKVKLRVLRSQTLPQGSTVNIYFDNATGVIDYDNPLNAEPIPVWPNNYDKAGFGISQFGNGDFGFDFAAAVGFGVGDFGSGMFGADADSIEWISSPMTKGVYKFAAAIIDKQGNISTTVETEPIKVIPDPTPATSLDIVSYNDSTNQLTLSYM